MYYGLGGVILLMLWLYGSGVALLVGAEIDSEIRDAADARDTPPAAVIGRPSSVWKSAGWSPPARFEASSTPASAVPGSGL